MSKKSKKPYKVGHKKPPVSHQFKKGQSGNPSGRPKGSRNFTTLVERELSAPITIEQGGTLKKIQRKDALAKGLVNDALKGRDRARETLLAYVERSDSSHQSRATREEISQKDHDIVQRFLDRQGKAD